MTADPGNLFDAIPDKLDEELFTQLAQGQAFRMERIVSRGQSSPKSGWYDQEEHEWVVVLRGEARLAFPDGPEKHLLSGDYISLPAGTKHRVSWTSPDTETVWLAIYYR